MVIPVSYCTGVKLDHF